MRARFVIEAELVFGTKMNNPIAAEFLEQPVRGGSIMVLSNESLIVIVIVGIVAGWLAGQVVRGGGFGLIGDLIVGIIGAFIGDWILPRIGIHLGAGMVSLVVNATIGAVILLVVLRLVTGGGGWGARPGFMNGRRRRPW